MIFHLQINPVPRVMGICVPLSPPNQPKTSIKSKDSGLISLPEAFPCLSQIEFLSRIESKGRWERNKESTCPACKPDINIPWSMLCRPWSSVMYAAWAQQLYDSLLNTHPFCSSVFRRQNIVRHFSSFLLVFSLLALEMSAGIGCIQIRI